MLGRKFTDYEVTGLLRSADVLLIMSLADGFNHSSVEGVLSKLTEDNPMLLLSSDVGSSDYLGNTQIKIQPYDKIDTAIKLHAALVNDEAQTRKVQAELKNHALRLTIKGWTLSILDAVININNVPIWNN